MGGRRSERTAARRVGGGRVFVRPIHTQSYVRTTHGLLALVREEGGLRGLGRTPWQRNALSLGNETRSRLRCHLFSLSLLLTCAARAARSTAARKSAVRSWAHGGGGPTAAKAGAVVGGILACSQQRPRGREK